VFVIDTRAIRLRSLRTADARAAGRLLGASHGEYPAFRHVYPAPEVRRRALVPFMTASAADAARFDASTAAWDRHVLVGVALWLPPGAFPWSARRKLRATPALARTALASPRSFPVFARIGAAVDRVHPQEPHWYLEALGVHPRCHGRGIGTALMAVGLRRADDDGLPCYLETSDPANEAFYRRLGFEVVKARLEHIAGGPPYLGMRRAPLPWPPAAA
jgi:ribosomal protein S18 acetylase RimI-like enzyme